MAAATGISWCDATQNFWIGCTKVGPGCDHCRFDMESDSVRVGKKNAGRHLDGIEHNGFPEQHP